MMSLSMLFFLKGKIKIITEALNLLLCQGPGDYYRSILILDAWYVP